MPSIDFAVIGTHHAHVYDIVDGLIAAGARLAGFAGDDEGGSAAFAARYAGARREKGAASILGREDVQAVVLCGLPSERADVACKAMRAGKDVIVDKPPAVTAGQLADVRRTQGETGRRFLVVFGELLSGALAKALELYREGRIGELVSVAGMAPHLLGEGRPEWFYDSARNGGLLVDIGCHQIAQFLTITADPAAELVDASIACFGGRDGFFDSGDIVLRSRRVRGYARVDWMTPDGLGEWGDVRTMITGTKGYLDVRKTVDIGRPESWDVLYVVDSRGIERIECEHAPPDFYSKLIADIHDRTDRSIPHEISFRTMELAIRAQEFAESRWPCIR